MPTLPRPHRPSHTALALLSLLPPAGAVGAGQPERRADRLADDRANVLWAAALAAHPPASADALAAAGERPWRRRDLGFGVERLAVSRADGYARLTVEALAFRGELAELAITVSVGQDREWVVDELAGLWRAAAGPDLEVSPRALSHRGSRAGVRQRLERALDRELGRRRPLAVPAGLREAYRRLASPWSEILFGGLCGPEGEVLDDRRTTEELIAARRAGLLAALLRSPNPEGRIDGALGLLRLGAEGLPLAAEVRPALERILADPLPIDTCLGWFLETSTAAELLAPLLPTPAAPPAEPPAQEGRRPPA